MSHPHKQQPDLVASIFRIFLMLFGIYLLIVITFPFFQQGNLTGIRRAACQSNMKQLGLALTQYMQDNDAEALPPTVLPTGQGWREAIYPYVKFVGIYQCSDDQRNGGSYSPENLPKSYGANSLGPGPDGKDRGAFAGPNEKPTKLQWDFINPAQTIELVDMRGWGGPEWNMVSPAFLPASGRRLYAHFPKHWIFERPPGRVNVLFMDGHVKSLLPEASLTPRNLWTRDNTPFTGPDLSNAQAILARAAQE